VAVSGIPMMGIIRPCSAVLRPVVGCPSIACVVGTVGIAAMGVIDDIFSAQDILMMLICIPKCSAEMEISKQELRYR